MSKNEIPEGADTRHYVIFDSEDGTYHYGDGDWGRDRAKAFLYADLDDAEDGLDDVDCEMILRDRLQIEKVSLSPTRKGDGQS